MFTPTKQARVSEKTTGDHVTFIQSCYFWFGFVDFVFGISKVEMGFVDCGVDRWRSRGRRRGRRRRKKTQTRDEGISVFFGFATVIYKTRITRFHSRLRVHNPFRVCSQFFLNAQNVTFIKKLRFEFTKCKRWLSFFQKAFFGLKKPKQTGSKSVRDNMT